ncbi:MAG: hypothetical protein ACP5HJ_02645 [Candidatus Micrarchaeia archaeon]
MRIRIFLIVFFFLSLFLLSFFQPIRIIKKGIFVAYANSSKGLKEIDDTFVSKYLNLSLAYNLYYNYSITNNKKALLQAQKFGNKSNLLIEFTNLLKEKNIGGVGEVSIFLPTEKFSFFPIFLITLVTYILFYTFKKDKLKLPILPLVSFVIVFSLLLIIGFDEFGVLALVSSFLFAFYKNEKPLTIFLICFIFFIVFYFLGFKIFEFFILFLVGSLSCFLIDRLYLVVKR